MPADPLLTAALALGADADPAADPDATFAAIRPRAVDRALTDPAFRALGPAGWTAAYERLIAHRPALTPRGFTLTPDRQARRHRGGWYTPPAVVDALLDRALDPIDPDALPTLCDPACGAGPFLLAAARRLTAALTARGVDPPAARRRAVAQLYGADLDPGAVRLARRVLEDFAGEPIPALDHHLATGDALLGPTPRHPVPPDAPPPRHPPVDWPALAPDGFDLVIGNPPYRAGRLADLDADRLRLTCPTAEYQLDPFALFLDRGARLTRPGGRLALLVPRTWMSNHRAARLRRWLLTTHRLDALLEVPDAAFDAVVATAIPVFTIDRGPSPETIPVTPAGTLSLPRDGAPLPLARTPRAAAILAASTRWTTPLGAIADVTRGVNPYHHTTHTPDQIRDRVHHADAPRPGWSPELRGRDLPAAYRVCPPTRWIHYGPWLKEPRDPRFFEGPRLLVRKILGDTLCAAYLDDPLYCDQSVYIVKLHPDQPYPPYAILACVASRLIATLLRTRHQCDDDAFPQLKVGDLRNLPLPPAPPDDPRWQPLARLAEAMQAGDTSQRGAIEAAVDALYGVPSTATPTNPPAHPADAGRQYDRPSITSRQRGIGSAQS